MSDDRESMQAIIDDWYINECDEKYHSEVNPEAMLHLVKIMVAHGYTKSELDTNRFKDSVVNVSTHDHSRKPKEWKKMVYKDINRAVKQWFPLMKVEKPTEEEMSRLAPVKEERLPRSKSDKKSHKVEEDIKSEYADYVEEEDVKHAKEIKPLDRSKFKNIETTPMDEDDFLNELGIKK